MESSTNTSSASHSSVQSPTSEKPALAIIAITGTDEEIDSLKSKLILSSGSNVHVVNEFYEDRIIVRRPATGKLLRLSGATIEVDEIVTVEIHLQNQGQQVKAFLTDAYYIKGFMTNLLSSPRMVAAGIYHDTREREYLYTEKDGERQRFCEGTRPPPGQLVLEDRSKSRRVIQTSVTL